MNTRHIKIITYATGAALVAGVLIGCGSDSVEKVPESAKSPAAVETADPDTTDQPDVVRESASTGTRAESGSVEKVVVGETASVWNWDVTITDVALNADAHLREVNQFNDPASYQYLLLTFDATYTGDGTGDVFWDLDWQFVGSDNVIYDDATVVTEADANDWPEETRTGGTLSSQLVFDVPPDAVAGGAFLLEVDREAAAEFAM